MNIKRSILLRVRAAFLLVAAFSGLIVWKISQIQWVEGDRWIAMAEESTVRYRTVPANRGHIFADDGSLLATSLPFYKVAMDATIAEDGVWEQGLDSLALMLSKHFGDNSQTSYKRKLQQARNERRQYLVLNSRTVDYQSMKAMQTWPIVREGRFGGGVFFEKNTRRYRPFNQLAMRTVGYTDETERGVVGLEYSFDDYLAGTEGQALFQRIAGGNWKQLFDAEDTKPEDGQDVYTTLNITFQDAAEQALLKALEDNRAEYGSLVLLETQTGAIKAMANLSRDDNGRYTERYNFIVQATMEPGSTFKIVGLAALLEEAKMTLADTIDTGKGAYRFYDRIMRDSKEGGYGVLTLQQVFENSSNVGISKLIDRHFSARPQVFLDYIQRFGFHEPLGFQLKGEGEPFIKNPNNQDWYGTTLPWMSIGYEVKVSPLQIAAAYNAIANNGRYAKPYLVKAIKEANKEVLAYEPEVQKTSILKQKTLDDLRTAMEGVVERGTATNLKSAYFSIAGKTGTAQIAFDRSGYRQDGKVTYQSSFVGYFPADNPQFTCLVVVGAPSASNYYGNTVAGPVFKAVADRIFAESPNFRKTVQPQLAEASESLPYIRGGYGPDLLSLSRVLDLPLSQEGEPYGFVKTAVSDAKIKLLPIQTDLNLMPNVAGLPLRDALPLLENMGLRVRTKGKGRVKSQSVPAGSRVNKGYAVTLSLEYDENG
jgi:cell division protein FtsI (penicillin-binding protein 3)